MLYASKFCLGLLTALALTAMTAHAYPEFERFVVKHSGRKINCALCHMHGDGPEGTAPGQIGRLTPAEQERLGRARAAFLPGQKLENPILNKFGNHIMECIGKRKFLELKLAPEKLSQVLPQNSDLDGDGIPDVREYLDGTHPLKANDGRPWLLFKSNLSKNLTQVALTLAATIAGLWGLSQLLHGFAAATRTHKEERGEEG